MILACEELFWLNIDITSRGFAGNVCSQIYVHRKFQIKRQPDFYYQSNKTRSAQKTNLKREKDNGLGGFGEVFQRFCFYMGG